MSKKIVPLILVAIPLIFLFALYVWPTKYVLYQEGKLEFRKNRLNDCIQAYYEGEWKHDPATFVESSRNECLNKQELVDKNENLRILKEKTEVNRKERVESDKRRSSYEIRKSVIIIPLLQGSASYGENLAGERRLVVNIYNPTYCYIDSPIIKVKQDNGYNAYKLERRIGKSSIGKMGLEPQQKSTYIYDVLADSTIMSGKIDWYIADIEYHSEGEKRYDYSCTVKSMDLMEKIK